VTLGINNVTLGIYNVTLGIYDVTPTRTAIMTLQFTIADYITIRVTDSLLLLFNLGTTGTHVTEVTANEMFGNKSTLIAGGIMTNVLIKFMPVAWSEL